MKIEVNVPNGESGSWLVEDMVVSQSDADFETMRAAFCSSSRPIQPGPYKRLVRNGTTVMSNTSAEISDHRYFIMKAKRCEHVLINGLGLGVALTAILESDIVKTVTVIEKSEDVINLVAKSFTDPRVSIVHADAFEFKPPKGKRYGAVWHDIWDGICADNLPEMTKLHRKYGRRCDWQGSWARELIRR